MPLLTYCRFEVDSRVTTQIPVRYWKLLAALQVFRSRLPALGVDYQEAALAQLGIQEECRTIFWDDVERFSQVNRSEPAG